MKNSESIISNLITINFINEYKKKQLPLGMCFFKICKNFPKSEIGKMKAAQMHYEKDVIRNIIKDDILSKSLLKKRAKTSARPGPYTKFLIKSLIETCGYEKDIEISDFHDKSFTFKKENIQYKISTNKSKLLENKIFIDTNEIFDENNIISFNCLKTLALKIPIKIDEIKLELANKYVNEIRQKYIDLYNKKTIMNSIEDTKLKNLWKKEESMRTENLKIKAS